MEAIHGSITKELVHYFEDVIVPPLHVDLSEKLSIPDHFYVKIGGGLRLLQLLSSPKHFCALEKGLQIAILDCLYYILSVSHHNVLRFQCIDVSQLPVSEASQRPHTTLSLIGICLDLIDGLQFCDNEDFSVTRRVIRLIGVVYSGGMSEGELNRVLQKVDTSSALDKSWLQCIQLMMSTSYLSTKTESGPDCFFNFGGTDAGLFSVLRPFPFQKEYQIFTSFRLEEAFRGNTSDSSEGSSESDLSSRMRASAMANSTHAASVTIGSSFAMLGITKADARKIVDADHSHRQCLFCINSSDSVVELFVENHAVIISFCDARGNEVQSIGIKTVPDAPLEPGKWYDICVKHSRPTSYNIFGSDELTVYINNRQVFQGQVKFPPSGNSSLTEFSVGRGFQGQVGPVFISSEAFPMGVVEHILGSLSSHYLNNLNNGASVSVGISSISLAMNNASSGGGSNLSPAALPAGGNSSSSASGSSVFGSSAVSSSGSKVTPTRNQSIRLPGQTAASNTTITDVSGDADLCSSFYVPAEKKSFVIAGKLVTCYHPLRCAYGHAIDLHGGRHARFGPRTFSSNVARPYKTLELIGGLRLLFPLFPSLLLDCIDETEDIDGNTSHSNKMYSRINSSPAANPGKLSNATAVSSGCSVNWKPALINTPCSALSLHSLRDESIRAGAFTVSTLSAVDGRNVAVNTHDSIFALLIDILASCLSASQTYQWELYRMGGIGMIEYFLSQLPQSVYENPAWERATLSSILHLRASVVNNQILEAKITKELLCNFSIWSRGSADLQLSVASIILSDAKSRSDYFVATLGVQKLLDYITIYYLDGVPGKSQKNHSNGSDSLSESHTWCVDAEDVVQPRDVVSQNGLSDEILQILETDAVNINIQLGDEFHAETISAAADFEIRNNGITDGKDGESDAVEPRGIEFLGRDEISTQGSQETPLRVKQIRRTTLFKDSLNSIRRRSKFLPSQLAVPSAEDTGDDSSIGASPASPSLNRKLTTSTDGCEIEDRSSTPSTIISANLNSVDDSISPSDHRRKALHNYGRPMQLSRLNRKKMRGGLRQIILAMIQNSAIGHRECKSVLMYMIFCRDVVVLEEFAQMVLYLLVEGDDRCLIAITEAFGGPEEFAALVLLRLVRHRGEDIRCAGMRILTRYYLRIDNLPSNVLNLSSKSSKSSILTRTIDKLASMAGDKQEMQRFQSSGGVTLLIQYLSGYVELSTERTYSAILEMLLTKPGSFSQVRVETKSSHTEVVDVSRNGSGLASGAVHFETSEDFSDKKIVFAAHYLSPDMVGDDEDDMTNAVILPAFFHLLPLLPASLLEQVIGDLLAMLKHNIGNRDAFTSALEWHKCMFNIVSQLIESARLTIPRCPVRTRDVLTQLEFSHSCDIGTEYGTGSGDKQTRTQVDKKDKLGGSHTAVSNINDPDLWFSVGMKVYSTLLQHVLHEKDGWWQVLATVSQAWSAEGLKDKRSSESIAGDADVSESMIGRSVSQAILSHLISEMTFTMRKTYADLKVKIVSKNAKKSKEASARLENILSVLTLGIEYALDVTSVVTMAVPNFREAKLRTDIMTRVVDEGNSFLGNVGSSRQPLQQCYVDQETLIITEDRLLHRLQVERANRIEMLEDQKRQSSYVSSSCGSEISSITGAAPSISIDGEFVVDPSFVWFTLPYDAASASGLEAVSEGSAPPKRKLLRPAMFCGDSLHPLERDISLEDGSLILILQTLRLFDSIFWSQEDSEIRNCSLLKVLRVPAALLSNTASSKMDTSSARQYHLGMTLFSTVFRASLFVLCSLSPLNDLSVLNITRLGYLLRAAANPEDVPRQTTPAIDWSLAAIVHTTLSLQRIVASLSAYFRHVGLSSPDLLVLVAGPLTSEQELLLVEVQLADAQFFASPDSNAKILANGLFETIQGKNLINFIKGCFRILVYVMDESWLRDMLTRALDIRDFEALSQFVDRISMASHALPTRRKSVGPMSPAAVSSAEGDLSTSGRQRDISVDSDDLSDDHNTTQSHVGMIGQAESKDVDDAGEAESFAAFSNIVADLTIVDVIRLLRDPFLRTVNLNRSISVVRSLQALDSAERHSNSAFFGDLDAARKSIIAQGTNASTAFVEEAKALRELSVSALNMASAREHARVLSTRAEEEASIKRAALQWTELLHRIENMKASECNEIPKQTSSCLNTLTPGAYELVRVSDSRLQRMVMTLALESKDHSDESYFDTLQRDQKLHMDALRNSAGEVHGSNGSLSSQGQVGDREVDDGAVDASITSSSVTVVSLRQASKIGWLKETSGSLRDQNWGDDDSSSVDYESDRERSSSFDSTGRTSSGTGDSFAGKSSDFLWTKGVELMGLEFTSMMSNYDNKRPHWTMPFAWLPDEKVLLQVNDVIQIKLDFKLRGDFLLSSKHIFFHPREIVGGHGTVSEVEFTDARWAIDRIAEMFGRRFQQKNCSLELFFVGSLEVLFAFPTPRVMRKCWSLIRSQLQAGSTMAQYLSSSLHPQQIIANSPWTELWRKRLISNYEYLMRLNVIAGRSFNDVSQYPVFPWIIADYTSPVLDLSNPSTFRDLELPMGALDPDRFAYFKERYNSFEPDSPLGPAFLYGSHYSTEGYVVYYMLRQEPFTTLGVNLQEGKFDCPDRLFFDIRRTWEGCSRQSVSDVKELIPEFFCCPEMFLNTNDWPLGELQEGGFVSDVVLPPWAENAFEFVRIHRQALESDIVSAKISDWIDLIFGYKQNGPAAIEARNVFHYLTYENAVDIDRIESEEQKSAVRAQVTHYGQTPSQLFRKPHPKRLSREECIIPLCDIPTADALKSIVVYTPRQGCDVKPSSSNSPFATGAGAMAQSGGKASQTIIANSPLLCVRCSTDRLVTCNAQYATTVYKFSSLPDPDGEPFQVRVLSEKPRHLTSHRFLKSSESLQHCSFVPLLPSYLRHQSISDNNSTSSNNGKRSGQIYSTHSLSTNPNAGDVASENQTESQVSDAINTQTPNVSKTPEVVSPQSPTPLATRRPLVNIFGAIRRGLTDISDYASSSPAPLTPPSGQAMSPGNNSGSNLSPTLSVSTQGSAQQASSSHGRLPLDKTRSRSVRSAYALDDILFGEGDIHQLPNQAVDRSVARSLVELAQQHILVRVEKEGNGRIISCGYWDNTIKVHALENGKELVSVNAGHVGPISCLAMGYQGSHLVISAGVDGTARVWALENAGLVNSCTDEKRITGKQSTDNDTLVCIHILRSHNCPITSLSYCPELDLVLTGDSNGMMCLHSARRGRFVRTLAHERGHSVDLCLVASTGYLVAYSRDSSHMSVCWINGQVLKKVTLLDGERLQCLIVSPNGQVVVSGSSRGRITFRSIWNLEVLRVIDLSQHGAITSLWFSEDFQYLLIGSDDGTFSIGTNPDASWKQADVSSLQAKLLRMEATS